MDDVGSIASDDAAFSPIQSIDTPVLGGSNPSNASSESGIIISDYEHATSFNSFSHRDIDTPDQSMADEVDPDKLATQLVVNFCHKYSKFNRNPVAFDFISDFN